MSDIIKCLDCGEEHIDGLPCIQCSACSTRFTLEELVSTAGGLMCEDCNYDYVGDLEATKAQDAYDAMVDHQIDVWKERRFEEDNDE